KISFALNRHLNPCVGPTWRSLQQILWGSSCTVKRECFYTSSNHLTSPQVSMVTSILFWRLASSRFRSQDTTSPQHENPGQCLGFSALLPFLGAPLLIAVTHSYLPEVAFPAQHDWMNLGNSVVPSLLAWLALHSRDNIAEGALVVIMGLCLLKALETILTLVATFSLDATLTLKEMCPEKKIKTVD
uniref:Uncharacterized protein n=1 Tax=Oncorhynchus tshawytscha TaxID=74940 RepID=A0A8C8M7U7_ONCTS